MPFSNGTFSLVSGNPVVSHQVIASSWANNTLSDIANGLSQTFLRSGAVPMSGQLLIIDGTATVPGIGFNSEPSTGIYKPTSGELAFTVEGVQAGVFSTTGLSTLNLSALNLNVTGTTVPANGLYLPAANTLGISTNSTERVSVSSAGNVTINAATSGVALTTTTNGATPALQITGGTSSQGFSDVLISRSSSANTIQNGPNITLSDGTTNNTVTLQAGAGTFGVWNYGGGTWLERVSVAPGGNVTINEPDTATSALKVVAHTTADALTLTTSGNTTNGTTSFYFDAGGNSYISADAAVNGTMYVGTNGTAPTILLTENTPRLTVNPAGAVSINSPSSGASLTVNSTNSQVMNLVSTGANNGPQVYFSGNNGSAYIGIDAFANDIFAIGTTAAVSLPLFLVTNSNERLGISAAGNVSINAPTSGSALTISGNTSTSSALVINSGMAGNISASDSIVNRAGSTANQVGQGPNLQLFDTTNLGGSIFQQSGGQTELWQYANSSGWVQSAYWNAARGLVLKPPSSGIALNVGAGTSTASPVALFYGSGAYISSSDGTHESLFGTSSIGGFVGTFTNHEFDIRTDNNPRISVSSSGNVAVSQPVSGSGLIVNGASGSYAAQVIGNSTTGNSDGLVVQAGTNASDVAFHIENYAQTADYMVMFGDGHGYIGPNPHTLSWNTSGAFTIAAPTSGNALTVTGLNTGQAASICAGTAPTNGDLVLVGQYGSGALLSLGSLYSSGATALGFGVGPVQGSAGFQSLTAINVGRSAITLGENNNITFYTGPAQATAIGTAPTLNNVGTISAAGNWTIPTPSSGTALTVNGTVSATAFNTTSDARLKTDIATIGNALDKVQALRGVSYKLKDSVETRVGVVAQEVQNVIPEVVSEVDGHLTVAYGNLVGVLIEAIKELKGRIEDMESLYGVGV